MLQVGGLGRFCTIRRHGVGGAEQEPQASGQASDAEYFQRGGMRDKGSHKRQQAGNGKEQEAKTGRVHGGAD